MLDSLKMCTKRADMMSLSPFFEKKNKTKERAELLNFIDKSKKHYNLAKLRFGNPLFSTLTKPLNFLKVNKELKEKKTQT